MKLNENGTLSFGDMGWKVGYGLFILGCLGLTDILAVYSVADDTYC